MKTCILNLSGILVDKFYIMNTRCLFKTFDKKKFIIPHTIYNNFSGVDSKYMIQNILLEDSLMKQWYLKYNCYPSLELDSRELNSIFNDYLTDEINDNLSINSDSKTVVDYLKSKNHKIGITTNYNYHITKLIVDSLINRKINIDYFSFTQNYDLRDKPFQIYDNIINLDNEYSKNVVVIDNTIEGVKRGLKSGCKTIAVLDGSPHMNIYTEKILEKYEILKTHSGNYFESPKNYNRYKFEYENKLKQCKQNFIDIGCEHIIDDLSDIQYIL